VAAPVLLAQAKSALPSPAATPTLAIHKSTAPPVRTIEEIQAEIRGRIHRPEFRRGQVGIKIVSLNSGKVLFEENAEKYFMPASNMKNFTVAAALEKLTPDFRFVTSVYASAMPDAVGVIKGDLRIFGRGDVSISTAFADGSYYKGLDDLADKLAAAGVKRVEGSIVADDSYFRGDPLPGDWEWGDLQWYYGAEISALPLNDSSVDLEIKPGPLGYLCAVKLSPYNPVYRVRNQCQTTAAGSTRTLRIEKALGQNVLEITGSLPIGNTGFNGSVSVTRPAELFAALLKQRLEAKGITVAGQYSVMSRPAATSRLDPASGPREKVEIAKIESAPLALIAAKTMKPSQNMYTETLLWTLGEEARKRMSATVPDVAASMPASQIPAAQPNSVSPSTAPAVSQNLNADMQKDSAELGLAEIKNFLTGIGIAPDSILQSDGSGLSRHNLVTPSAIVQLYIYMAKQSKFSQAWRDSLTIGGVDGTLANRFKGTAAQNNMRGKTGTIDQVSALSGYVTTAAGEPLVVSFIVNGVPTGRDRTSMMDDIVVALARFNGKID